ncbi:hypothetical protein EDB86DRAFT_3247011 [Lactarius hatsudake]|nr:hypothetical protein EDB86DRAFT_3247011 [Lactarius hatsudake]
MTVAAAYKPLTADRIEDMTLGAFGNLRPSETLNHIRYLSTWSGSDLSNMGQSADPYSGSMSAPPTAQASIALKLAKLASTIGSARSLWGYRSQTTSGMLPIIRWLIALERAPTPTRRLLTIERTQGCPPSSARTTSSPAFHLPTLSGGKPRRVAIHDGAVTLWSTRLWMAYVVLQLAHLREDCALLVKRQRALEKLSLRGGQPSLPFSVKRPTQIWISLFGFAAAIAPLRSGWKVNALSPPPPPAEPSGDAPEVSDIALVTNDTDSSFQ